MDLGATDVAPPDADEALGLEDAHRLANGGPGHAELVEQVVLLGKQVAVRQLTVDDPSSEDVGHHLGHAWLAQLPRAPLESAVHHRLAFIII
jgi:hypothetical protein